MRPHTIATLEQLQHSDWFANVGTYAGLRDHSKVIVLSSWEDAIAHCSSVGWENLCLEAVNQYCEHLMERSSERFNQWNDITETIRPSVERLVRQKTDAVMDEHDLPNVFRNTVEWDIHHLCMEAEYADVYPPGFYASQAYWYIHGHFPCGWSGDFPKGKLIIY